MYKSLAYLSKEFSYIGLAGIPLPLVPLINTFLSPDPLTLFHGYKSPRVLVVFRVELHLPPLTAIVLGQVFLTVLTTVGILSFLQYPSVLGKS